MSKYKKFIRNFFIIMIIIIPSIAAFNYIIDPLQHYRKSVFYKPYSLEQRYMAWGLLRNYEYDSILVGTSMTENFRKDYIDEDLTLDILRVPLSGLSAYEANLIMGKGLKNKNLTTIIYGLDLFSFDGGEKRLRDEEGSLPEYIMNDTFLDDYKYLLNMDIFFNNNIKVFSANILGIKKENINFNKFWNWDYKVKFNKKLTLQSYYKELENIKETKNIEDYKFDTLRKSFDFNILKHIKTNQNIKFEIFFPPYSILTWKSWEEKKYLADYLKFKEYILEKSIEFKNIQLYDFQIEDKITHNLDNYKDISHYSGDINRWIIKQIRSKHYLIKEDNIEKNLEELKRQIDNYKLETIL